MTFTLFKLLMLQHVLEFRPGEEWDTDDWNEAYVDFKSGMGAFNQKYIDKIGPEKHVIEWGKEYYQDASFDTHSYQVKK